MQIYLVGGAVRDKLLGLKPHERDFVVVGSTPEKMLERGFKQVGRGFPVFLHPKTHEEYALARTEHKVGKGYTEFQCHSDPNITLEQDLLRRDLTINAIAEDENGNLIDPYGGTSDLENKILRHVSDAFTEDPLRILRVARFASRFPEFKIHPKTLKLMQKIVATPNEINSLVTERVWLECTKALTYQAPWRFFEVLDSCGALNILFSELKPALNTVLTNLSITTRLSLDPKIRWAALGSPLKLDAAQTLQKRLKPPRLFSELLVMTIRSSDAIKNALQLSGEQILNLFTRCDAFRKPQRFFSMLLALECQNPTIPSPQFTHLRQIFLATNKINIKNLVAQNLTGEEFRSQLTKLRLAMIEAPR